jgi:D-glycero-D-manno-heptose 1,7-bisphosphate phosphatase
MEAIFLDRDGVINRKPPEGKYVATAVDLHFLPGALESIVALFRSGYSVFIVTNQRGIARGIMTHRDLEGIHALLHDSVRRRGGQIQKIYVCSHDHHEHCHCRKPRPGMLLQAKKEYGIDLSASWMIGDSASDLIAGKQAGCRTAFVDNVTSNSLLIDADVVGASLAEIAEFIIRQRRGGNLISRYSFDVVH